MTDDAPNTTDEMATLTDLSGDRARRSRRRGRRGKSKTGEARLNQPLQTALADEPPVETPEVIAPPRPQPHRLPEIKRTHFQPYQDGFDRFVCPDCLRFLPVAYPVHHRRGSAELALIEVDRNDAELLLCNGLHEGPCSWPDGAVVQVTTVDEQSGTTTARLEPEPSPSIEAPSDLDQPEEPAASIAEVPTAPEEEPE